MGRGGSEDAAPVAEAGASAAAATEPEQNTAAQAAQENEEKVSDLLPARESKKTTTANTNTKKNQAAMVFDIKPRRFTHTLSFFFLSCLHLGLTPNLSKRWRAKGVRKKRKRSSATQTT